MQAHTSPFANSRGMSWNLAGIIGALALGAFAFFKSRARGGYYDAEVYGMTPAMHLRYAALSAAVVALFVAFWVFGVHAEVALFAALVLLAIFYLTSFLRGAHEDDG